MVQLGGIFLSFSVTSFPTISFWKEDIERTEDMCSSGIQNCLTFVTFWSVYFFINIFDALQY